MKKRSGFLMEIRFEKSTEKWIIKRKKNASLKRNNDNWMLKTGW